MAQTSLPVFDNTGDCLATFALMRQLLVGLAVSSTSQPFASMSDVPKTRPSNPSRTPCRLPAASTYHPATSGLKRRDPSGLRKKARNALLAAAAEVPFGRV